MNFIGAIGTAMAMVSMIHVVFRDDFQIAVVTGLAGIIFALCGITQSIAKSSK